MDHLILKVIGNMVKQVRAYDGCLGIGWRRRTWVAAISIGEP